MLVLPVPLFFNSDPDCLLYINNDNVNFFSRTLAHYVRRNSLTLTAISRTARAHISMRSQLLFCHTRNNMASTIRSTSHWSDIAILQISFQNGSRRILDILYSTGNLRRDGPHVRIGAPLAALLRVDFDFGFEHFTSHHT